MNELTAVNKMLRSIGQVPVRELPDGGQSDARVARDTLLDYALELQQEGYDFNTDEKVKLEPDVSGLIPFTDDVLRIKPSGYGRRYTIRNRRLYSLDDKTDIFDNPQELDIIRQVPFEELPFSLQNYVVIRAARVFANQVVGAPEQNGYNSEDEARARIAWLNTVAEDMHLNLLSDSGHQRPRSSQPYQALTRGF